MNPSIHASPEGEEVKTEGSGAKPAGAPAKAEHPQSSCAFGFISLSEFDNLEPSSPVPPARLGEEKDLDGSLTLTDAARLRKALEAAIENNHRLSVEGASVTDRYITLLAAARSALSETGEG